MKAQFEQAGFNNVTLVPAGGGVFEISINGNLKYSKKANGRFPEDAEVTAIAST